MNQIMFFGLIFDLNYFLKLCQLISSYKEKEKQNE